MLILKLQHFSSPDEKVWGAAYHIPPEHVDHVRSYLDIREINGYSIQYTPFHPAATSMLGPTASRNSEMISCLVYIGLPDNPQFLGPQDPQDLATHILRSKGPSGENREYLYMLGEALQSLSIESADEHVRDLVKRCQTLEAEGWGIITQSHGGHELRKIGSTEEQEEVEKATR